MPALTTIEPTNQPGPAGTTAKEHPQMTTPTTNRDAIERLAAVPAQVARVLAHRDRQLASIETNERHDAALKARLVADADAVARAHLDTERGNVASYVQGAQVAIARSAPSDAAQMTTELTQAQTAAETALDAADAELAGS